MLITRSMYSTHAHMICYSTSLRHKRYDDHHTGMRYEYYVNLIRIAAGWARVFSYIGAMFLPCCVVFNDFMQYNHKAPKILYYAHVHLPYTHTQSHKLTNTQTREYTERSRERSHVYTTLP